MSNSSFITAFTFKSLGKALSNISTCDYSRNPLLTIILQPLLLWLRIIPCRFRFQHSTRLLLRRCEYNLIYIWTVRSVMHSESHSCSF